MIVKGAKYVANITIFNIQYIILLYNYVFLLVFISYHVIYYGGGAIVITGSFLPAITYEYDANAAASVVLNITNAVPPIGASSYEKSCYWINIFLYSSI